MGYIYVITNDINNKQYVGQTSFSLKNRLKEHLTDYKCARDKNRPLYRAIAKYGTQHFNITELEECSDDKLNEREIYWIAKLNTFKDGYNATKGGDGTVLYDHEAIWEKYQELKNIMQTAKYFQCDRRVVRKVINTHGIYNSPAPSNICVYQYDIKTGKYITSYSSYAQASIAVKGDKQGRHGIQAAINPNLPNKETAYGYRWSLEKKDYLSFKHKFIIQEDLQHNVLNIFYDYQEVFQFLQQNIINFRSQYQNCRDKIRRTIVKQSAYYGFYWREEERIINKN